MARIITNIEVAGARWMARIRYDEFVEEFRRALLGQRFMKRKAYAGRLTINQFAIQAQDRGID